MTDTNLSTATATVDQMEPFRDIWMKGRIQGKIWGWTSSFHFPQMRGREKEIIMQMTNTVSNMASMIRICLNVTWERKV
jgi:hypothetical protein